MALSKRDAQVFSVLFDESSILDEDVDIGTKQLELEGLEFVAVIDYEAALVKFNEALERSPSFGSVYNNRAQLFRLMGRDTEARSDLDLAIQYGGGRTLKQAYTQRAVMKRNCGDLDGADDDFKMGAKHGSAIAKGMVADNPYSKM